MDNFWLTAVIMVVVFLCAALGPAVVSYFRSGLHKIPASKGFRRKP